VDQQDHKLIREIGKIVETFRPLTARYYALTGRPLGFAGELGEYEAAKRLGLKLAPARTPRYDATDRKGRTFQIKTRVYLPGGIPVSGWAQSRSMHPCDAVPKP
jgi:hypothetical protein